MDIIKMTEAHSNEIIAMMRDFYASPAVSTNGSEEIFMSDVENCISDNPYVEGYVFCEGNVIMGYSMIANSFSTEFGKKCVWIEDIYLKPEYRCKGYGSEFMKYIESINPGVLLRLEAEEDNKCAVHVYEKHGFDTFPYMELKKNT